MINIGDKAPELLGRDEEGREIRMSDYKGKRLVLYFYPKDLTSGCTAEACSFRDQRDLLLQKGMEIVGVSVDDARQHQKFKEKHGLNFPLIADVDHKLGAQFGVWQEKSMYGRKYMGTVRTTFIIGPDGTVEQIIGPKQIKTKIHAEQILG